MTLSVRETLMSLASASVQEVNDTLILTIPDRQKWNEEIHKLESIFGAMIFNEYERTQRPFNPGNVHHQQRMDHQCKVSFADIDQLFVIIMKVHDKEQAIGFSSVEHYRGSRTCGIIRDIVVDRDVRGKKFRFGEKLAELVWNHARFHTILGYTRSPRAVRIGYDMAKQYGFDIYFGNTSNKHRAAESYQKKTVSYLAEKGELSPNHEKENLPCGYVLLRGELEILPTERIDLNLLNTRANPLYPPFAELDELQKKMNEKAKSEGRLPDSVAGIFVAIRQPVR